MASLPYVDSVGALSHASVAHQSILTLQHPDTLAIVPGVRLYLIIATG